MTYTVDPAYRMLVPHDEEAPRRAERLRELGIREEPDAEFDEFAEKLARATQAQYAMVNIVWPQRQYFAGLYPSSATRGVEWRADPLREMACSHGYCMHVVVRRHALALPEVSDYARFAVNAVVDEIGIRAYLGAPLVDSTVGMILGTICCVDTRPRPSWDLTTVEWIKGQAAELTERMLQRACARPGSPDDHGLAGFPPTGTMGHRLDNRSVPSDAYPGGLLPWPLRIGTIAEHSCRIGSNTDYWRECVS